MKVRILRNYGNLKKDQIIDAVGNQKQFLLENQIACVAPKKEGCNDDCDECDDCAGKNKKKTPAKKQSTTKKKK